MQTAAEYDRGHFYRHTHICVSCLNGLADHTGSHSALSRQTSGRNSETDAHAVVKCIEPNAYLRVRRFLTPGRQKAIKNHSQKTSSPWAVMLSWQLGNRTDKVSRKYSGIFFLGGVHCGIFQRITLRENPGGIFLVEMFLAWGNFPG